MSSHHNHPSHVHNFVNKHTALALLLLIIGCFFAGYFMGRHSFNNDSYEGQYRNGRYMMGEYPDSLYR